MATGWKCLPALKPGFETQSQSRRDLSLLVPIETEGAMTESQNAAILNPTLQKPQSFNLCASFGVNMLLLAC